MVDEKDPEVNSQFAQGKRLAKERGTRPGVDPVTGEIAAISYREIYNAVDGDEARADQIHRELRAAGGYGDIGREQYMDIRSLSRSVEENKRLADGADDLFAQRRNEQQAQHQDNLVNDVSQVLEKLKKG